MMINTDATMCYLEEISKIEEFLGREVKGTPIWRVSR